ncbi:Component of Sp100-rs [Heterocephalus glaber]|uniref:Component of Sp100-rs n=1 Tax=Heterocephalus glaber TaxID=10181 RepID=G5ASW4_HETGA|nr:Component of Sp100-rs [Heterocephalus glaber]
MAQEVLGAGAKLCLKTMNLSSEPCNISDWLRPEATVKASVSVVTFSFGTSITIIITTVSQNLKLWRQNRELQGRLHHWMCCWGGQFKQKLSHVNERLQS